MTNETQEVEGEKLCRQLVSGAQDLVRRVSAHEGTAHFENFVEEQKSLREKLILGYDSMSREQYERAGFLINQAKQYLHETLDVQRVREMRTTLERPYKHKK